LADGHIYRSRAGWRSSEQRRRLRAHADGYPIGPGAYGRRVRAEV